VSSGTARPQRRLRPAELGRSSGLCHDQVLSEAILVAIVMQYCCPQSRLAAACPVFLDRDMHPGDDIGSRVFTMSRFSFVTSFSS